MTEPPAPKAAAIDYYQTLWWLYRSLGPETSWCVWRLVFQELTEGVYFFSPLILGWCFTALTAGNLPLSYHYAFVFAAVLAIGWWLVRLTSIFAVRLNNTLQSQAVAYNTRQVLIQSEEFFHTQRIGALTARTSDFGLSFDFVNVTQETISGITSIILPIIGLSIFYPIYGLVFGVYTLGMSAILIVLYRHMIPFQKAHQKTRNDFRGYFIDTITGHSIVRSFGRRIAEISTIIDGYAPLRASINDLAVKRQMLIATQRFLSISFLIGNLFLGIYLVEHSVFAIGVIVTVWQYTNRIDAALGGIGTLMTQWWDILSRGSEAMEMLEQVPSVQDRPGAPLFQPRDGSIVIDDISFNYSWKSIFDHFSLEISSGEKIGIVGKSGGGKSTLFRLIARLYDLNSGQIRIGCEDIAAVQQDSLRAQIATVPQEPLLFHRSIRDNICYNHPLTDDELRRIQADACLDFIETLPHGLDTLVGERGVKLSGGERQRVAIARAMARQSRVVLLDEATSSLDIVSEQQIQRALVRLWQDKTVLVIAHRLSTILQMDRIIFLDQGKILSMGSHTELIEQSPLYRSWLEMSGLL